MYRLLCGTTHLKIINFDKTPSGKAAPGGPMEATGLRYLTIHVPDLKGLLAHLETKGIKPFMPITEIRPGVTIAMVSDPDGNTVEFLQPALTIRGAAVVHRAERAPAVSASWADSSTASTWSRVTLGKSSRNSFEAVCLLRSNR